METNFEIACNDFVSREVDRLARLQPCELMQLERKSEELTVAGKAAKLFHSVADFGDHRCIGVILEIPGILRVGERQFQGGVKVELRSQRMSDVEAAELFN